MLQFDTQRSRVLRMLIVIGVAALIIYTGSAALVGKPPIIRDAFNYNASAMRLLNTGVFQYDHYPATEVEVHSGGSAFTMPGYTLALAKVYLLLPHSGATADEVIANMLGAQPFIIAMQLAMAVAVAVLVAYAALRIKGLGAGWTAGVLAVAYLPFGFNATVPLTETVALFLMAVMVCAVAALLGSDQQLPRKHAYAWMAVFGLAAGYSILVRAVVGLWLIVPLVVWLASQRSRLPRAARPAALGAAVVLLVVTPWVARNAVSFGEFIPLTSSSSTVLLDSTGGAVFTPAEELLMEQAEATGDDPLRAVALQRLKTRWSVSPAGFLSWKLDTLWTGISNITNLPVDILIDFQYSGVPEEGTYVPSETFLPIQSDQTYVTLFQVLRGYHFVLLALALMGFAMNVRRPVAWVLASVPVYYALVHTALLFMVRYFYPAMVPIIVLAALGAAGTYSLATKQRRTPAAEIDEEL